MRRPASALLSLVFLALGLVGARAAELVVFERAGCVWCARWNAEVGATYAKTAESRKAALRRVDLADGVPADLARLRPVVFTPTFVLVEEGREIGRIEGYADEAFFYAYLGGLIGKLEATTH